MYSEFIQFVKRLYPGEKFIPLHEPRFIGNEKKYLNECIDSTFVSSVGKFVDRFEEMIADYIGVKHAVATMNGTAALHMCLILADVQQDDEVITQPLSFIATCNAIAYCRAQPVFVDVDLETLGMSAQALATFLADNTSMKQGVCYNKHTGRRVKACVPMHTFGRPCEIDEIKKLCEAHAITLIEDAAEALGSQYKGKALGAFGDLAAISFNGNKIATSGGGGVVLTNDTALAKAAKHLTTTAKLSHAWEYRHDRVGYNYRLPNLNAALLCAQLEKLDYFVENKRQLATLYQQFFAQSDLAEFMVESPHSHINYWLNAIKLHDPECRDQFLAETNKAGVMTRPIWVLMNKLDMYQDCYHDGLPNATTLEKQIINLPSSVRLEKQLC